jgi:bacterioferritin (cytochrome b1)
MTTRLTEDELPLPSTEFADQLTAEIDDYIEEYGLDNARFDTQLTEDQMREGLYTRIYNELVAVDLSRRMLDDLDASDDPQAFVHLLKQMGDEAKHARMLSQRLWNLGGDPTKVFERANESTQSFWEMFDNLDVIETTVMLQCGAERMAQHRHEKELRFYDDETAEIYRNVISPEEKFHAKIGVNLLRKLCIDRETQLKALRKSREGRELIRSHHDKGVQNAYADTDN